MAVWRRLSLPYVKDDAHVTVLHWADTALAAAWFRKAQELANDTARIADLDRGWPGGQRVTGGAIDRGLGERQLDFVTKIVEALANGYNALNVPWYNHPTARSLWREWWSGPATQVSESPVRTTEFLAEPDWNDAWYKGPRPAWMFPVSAQLDLLRGGHPTTGTTLFRGRIPMEAQRRFRELYPQRNYANTHPIELIPQAGMTLGLPAGVPLREHVQISYERQVVNAPFSLLLYVGTHCPPPTDIFTCNESSGSQNCRIGNRTCDSVAPGALFDWRSFYFDGAVVLFGVEVDPMIKLATRVPLRDHLPWLQAWANAAAAQSPESIILDARGWVWRVNASWQEEFGSEEGFMSAVFTNPSQVREQMHRPDPTATAVAGGVATIGTALSAVTFGISGLIGGVAASAIQLADMAIDKAASGVGRDDLGRYKPVYERASLTGDPSSVNLSPTHPVPEPDGFRRNVLVSLYVTPPTLEMYNVDGVNRPVVRPLSPQTQTLIGHPWENLPAIPSVDVVSPFQPFPFEPAPIPDTSVPPPPPVVQPPAPEGMSTGTKVALAVGAAAAVGAVAYVATRPKPARARR